MSSGFVKISTTVLLGSKIISTHKKSYTDTVANKYSDLIQLTIFIRIKVGYAGLGTCALAKGLQCKLIIILLEYFSGVSFSQVVAKSPGRQNEFQHQRKKLCTGDKIINF